MTVTALPDPCIIDPACVPPLRWGVIGTGVAGKFVGALHRSTPQRAVAVAARDLAKTSAFAARHGIPIAHSSVDALLDDPAVDAVYVATPHPLHREQALAAIAAGKHVLIEKPIAMSAAEAAEITTAGRSAGRLVMEAMWTRYLPVADVLRRVLEEQLIGDIRRVEASFGFACPYSPDHRLWNPDLGGGALLDAGIYPISWASSILGAPERIEVAGDVGPGVDARADLLLISPGATALVSASLVAPLPGTVSIAGSRGAITVGPPAYNPSELTMRLRTASDELVGRWSDDGTVARDGHAFQATAFARYVLEGRTESPVHPHAEVVSIMATIDEARRRLGVGAAR